MTKRTLARHRLQNSGAGWSHPYRTGPFDPFLYADGGDGAGAGSGSGDGGTGGDGGGDGPDDGGDSDKDGGGGNNSGDEGGAGDGSGKDTAAADKGGEDPAAHIARLTKELAEARKDAGKARTDAKKQAAEEAKASLVQELGKALGLIKDDKETPPDPARLTAEIERATAAHRETAIELAVFKGASRHGADPGSLTDSRAFMAKLAKLDPSEEGFAKKVSDAIKQAVADNPKLKTSPPAPDRAVGDFNGAPDDKGAKATGIEAQREARRKARTG